MNNGEWLQQATKRLEKAGIATARLDSLVLLEDTTGKDRSWLLAHPEFDVKGPSFHILEGQIARRVGHEPLAYIRGKTEFYGREFLISKDVLEPRPESETMIELLKQLIGRRTEGRGRSIVDVGTGSGALAITVKLELPGASLFATDIDPKCLKIASQNAKKHSAGIKFYQGDLLEPLLSTFVRPWRIRLSTALANLPYVPDSHTVNQAAMSEPRRAIFGGEDGLDLYRKLFHQVQAHRPTYIFTESLPFQHQDLKSIAEQSNFKQIEEADFIQVFAS